MNYCELTDLLKKETKQVLVDLTNDGSGQEIKMDVLNDAILRSTDVVNSFIRGRFPVPISEVMSEIPDSIKGITADIALFFLYSRQLRTNIPDNIKDLYKNAKMELTEYQIGKRSIDQRDSGNELVTPVKYKSKCSQLNNSQYLEGY